MNVRNINHRRGVLIALSLMITAIMVYNVSCDRSDSPTDAAIVVSGAADGRAIEISGQTVSYTCCKDFGEASYTDNIPATQSAVSWSYDGNGTLDIEHINAAFNCCPESLGCEISLEDRTITFKEKEYFGQSGGCFCLCLYDVAYRVTGLPPGKYQIRFEELHLAPSAESLDFSATMKGSGSSGIYTVDRCSYPWDECEPTGTLINCQEVGACCTESDGCLEWDYGDGGFLALTHRNWYGSGGIVSVPSVEFDFSSNSITITEDVMMGPLTVMTCVQFDLMIADLPPGEYLVTLNRFMGLPPVEFTLDLINQPTGEIGFD